MSKSRNHGSELDQLRQELRNLKSENRHLRKQLARAGKSLHRLVELEEIAKDDGLLEIKQEQSTKCPECGGKLKISNIADIRMITSCNDCKYRKTEKRKK